MFSPADIATLPFDDWVNGFVRGWLVPNFRPAFRAAQVPISAVLAWTEAFFLFVPMLVTTNTERTLADISIGAVGTRYFSDSVTGDEVPRPKPAPDMYLRAAEIVGADPADCLVFEDSFTGMTAAVTAGCRVIGLPRYSDTVVPEGVVTLESLHGRNDFVGADADTVMDWFHQLKR